MAAHKRMRPLKLVAAVDRNAAAVVDSHAVVVAADRTAAANTSKRSQQV
jgi:hypothetical protein